MRRDKERLLDILEAIELLEKSSNKNLSQVNEIELFGIVKCLEIIGEACRSLSEGLKAQYPNVPWRLIANMRNILVHQYFEIDVEKVEKVLERDIYKLRKEVESILEKI